MASTYSSNLKIELIGTGEQSGAWGSTTNTNLGTALEEAIVGRATANFTADADLTLTLTNSNAAQVARAYVLNVTSAVSLTATRNLIVPTINKPYIIQNNTTGSQSITVKTAAGTGVTVPAGREAMVYVDGTNVLAAFDYAPSLTLGTALAVASGGTGSTTADGARTNLGATTVGANVFTAANPSAITFLRVNADNTVSLLDAATFRTAIGAGTGGGDVTGPASAVSANIATFNGITGKIIQDGGKALPAGAVVGTTDTQTLTNKTITLVAGFETKAAIAASAIDLSLANYFTKTISTTTTFTVSNVPASGTTASFILELTNGGSATVTWFSGVKWAGGTAPTLTAAGVDILGFYTHDGGTTWRGLVLAKDSK